MFFFKRSLLKKNIDTNASSDLYKRLNIEPATLRQSGLNEDLTVKNNVLVNFRDHIARLLNCGTESQNFYCADRLLASWNLVKNVAPYSSLEKQEVLSKLRFGKGSKKNKYGDRRWTHEAREEHLLSL
jgi:hypothetical protein